jgi:hypothetical protein
MFKYSHRRSSYLVINVTGAFLLIGTMYQSFSPTLADEASVYHPIAGNSTTATYSDANQSGLIIHTTSNGISTTEPLSNTGKLPILSTENDRTPRSSQESPSTLLEVPSDDEPIAESQP